MKPLTLDEQIRHLSQCTEGMSLYYGSLGEREIKDLSGITLRARLSRDTRLVDVRDEVRVVQSIKEHGIYVVGAVTITWTVYKRKTWGGMVEQEVRFSAVAADVNGENVHQRLYDICMVAMVLSALNPRQVSKRVFG